MISDPSKNQTSSKDLNKKDATIKAIPGVFKIPKIHSFTKLGICHYRVGE